MLAVDLIILGRTNRKCLELFYY